MILLALIAVLLPYPKDYSELPGYFRHMRRLEDRVSVSYVDSIPEAGRHQDEAYTLAVDKHMVRISAVTPTGEMRARQTLKQLCTGEKRIRKIKRCIITDWAAFPHRGFLQDCGRSYISLEELCTEIRALASMKMNVFHWHLTENQAWRLESRAYPQLNAAENMTRFKGRYYSRKDVETVKRLCDSLCVRLIPEIEVPGHSDAFTRCFGFDMQSDRGKAIVRELLEEACGLFKGCEYFHLGTDEVKITDREFVPEMVSIVRSRGFKVISWNPGFTYKPGEIDALQLWSYRGKAIPGIPAIDSKLHYLNHFDTFADIPILYGLKPYGENEGTDDIIGSEIALWHDRFVPEEEQMVAQNGLYAAAAVLAERLWAGGEPGNFEEFEDRFIGLKTTSLAGLPIPYVRQSQVRWNISKAFDNGGNTDKSFPIEEGIMDERIIDGVANGAGVYLRHVWGAICPQYFADPRPNSTVYAWTNVWSPRAQNVGVLAEFQNYSRSETDIAPPKGQWDWKGSRAWINGDELLPPEWTEVAGIKPDNETVLGNQNLSARPPLPVKLRKGWNRVLLKLPVGEFTSDEVRLVKWMFNFVFVTPDGREAAPGLRYEP